MGDGVQACPPCWPGPGQGRELSLESCPCQGNSSENVGSRQGGDGHQAARVEQADVLLQAKVQWKRVPRKSQAFPPCLTEALGNE